MSRERSPRRPRRRDRNALIAAALTALSLTASGCVVVHGEREVLPAATRAEAAKAVTAPWTPPMSPAPSPTSTPPG
ncbi:hypothetical protein SUDANB181_05131 [Streptomyces sp. enrichment culture]